MYAVGEVTQGHGFSWDLRGIANDFVLSDEGVDFSERRKAKIEDAGKCYATTAKGQALARFFAKIAQAFTEEEIHKHLWFSDRKRPQGAEIAQLFARVDLLCFDTETGTPIYPNTFNNETPGWRPDHNNF